MLPTVGAKAETADHAAHLTKSPSDVVPCQVQEGDKQPVVAVVVEGIAQEAERKRQEWVEAENRRMLERWYWDELHDAYGRRWWRHKETHQEVSTCPF